MLSSRFLAGVLASTLLLAAGCSALPDKMYPPAPLPKISNQVELTQVWADSSGSGQLNRGYDLIPSLSSLESSEGDSFSYLSSSDSDIKREKQKELLIAGDAEGLVQAFELSRSGWLKGLFNPVSDKLLWKKQLSSGLSAGISQDEERAYFATQNGQLIAVNKMTGEQVWQQELASEVLISPQLASAEASFSDASNLLVVITSNGQINAFNRETGSRVWSYSSLMPSLSLRGSSPPLVSRFFTFIGLANGKLLALDNTTGQPRWEARLAQPEGRTDIERLVDVRGKPIEAQGYIFANSYQGETHALDPFNGRSQWNKKLSSYQGISYVPPRFSEDFASSSPLSNGALIVIDEKSQVHALDPITGSTLWLQNKLYGRELTQAVLLEDVLVVADYQGYLHLIQPETGALVGRASFDLDGISTSLLVSQLSGATKQRLLVHSNRGKLGLFELKPNKANSKEQKAASHQEENQEQIQQEETYQFRLFDGFNTD